MSSWVLLLWALAACARFVYMEGDPLPPALVELVRTSAISSIQDLQLLLEPDSVDEDLDSQTSKRHHANGTSKRLPRSLAAEQARQALCKVRTEVLEVTRDMLDRRNANFMLWPPCVEVQRCSGCCNSRTVQCVPIVTRTRYLQVMKIQYINKKPQYEKAVISVQDHEECRCQSSAPPAPPRTTPKKPQHALQPQRPAPKAPPLKTPSKEELHRQDELKQNQNLRPDHRSPQRPPWPAKHIPAQTQTQTSPALDTVGRAQSESRQSGAEGKEPPPTQETLGAHREEGDRKHRSGDGSAVRPLTEQQPHPHRVNPNITANHTAPHRPTGRHGPNPNITANHTAPHRPTGPHGPNPNITANHTAPHRPTEPHTHPHGLNPSTTAKHTARHRPTEPHMHRTQAGSLLQQGSVLHDHSMKRNHSHDHSDNRHRNHNQNHNHSNDNNHDCNQNHNHSCGQNHNHNQDHNHNHKHNHSHNMNHNHNQNHKHNHSHNMNHSHNQNHKHNHSHNINRNHTHSHSYDLNQDRNHSQTEASEQKQHTVEQHKDRALPEMEGGQLLQKQELLLLQSKLEQEKEQLKQQEESQQHHHRQHHLHHGGQVHTTTQRPVTPAPSAVRPPLTQRAPTRHAPPRRRLRKHRRRISKATMRAMLM